MSRIERAKEYFLQGYNCSQAVAKAFADVVSVDEGTLARIMLPFGGGMGRLRLTCGAVSGMAAIVGLSTAESEHSVENKKEVYGDVQALCAKFKEAYGSLICGELLSGKVPVEVGGVSEARTPEYYKKRPCGEMVGFAAGLVEEYLKEKGIL